MGQFTPSPTPMVSSLSQAEVLIALVVAAHAGVLAVRLCFSLYEA
jgi:photosystem I subunit 12